LFAQPPRLQLRGSDGFSPSSRTPEEKIYHPPNYLVKRKLADPNMMAA
jgi:hypothetical protein